MKIESKIIKNKLLYIISVFVFLFGLLCGCTEKAEPLPYNAVVTLDYFINEDTIIPSDFNYFTDNFWTENVIRGIAYKDEDGNDISFYENENVPQTRLHIITDQTQYDNIFIESKEIDFENRMIVVYLHCGSSKYKVKSINKKDDILEVEYSREKSKKLNCGRKDAVAPVRKILVLEMDKLEIQTVRFI